jgi:hypothetical protein
MPIAMKAPTIRAAVMAACACGALAARRASYHRVDLRFGPKAATISLRMSRSAVGRSEGAQ